MEYDNTTKELSVTLSDVKQKLSAADTFSDDWHKNIVSWRQLYDFNHYPDTKPKSGETQYCDPIYTNTIDLAVGILQSNSMVWKVHGWKPGRSEERKSSVVERFLPAVVDANSDRYEMDIPYWINLHFARDGCGVLYSVWDKEAENSMEEVFDEETKQRYMLYHRLPIITRVVDPISIKLLPSRSNDRWNCVFRVEKMSVYDVESIYGVPIKDYVGMSDTEKMDQKLDFIDYWEIKNLPGLGRVVCNGVIFSDQFILPVRIMEGYESIPYTISFFKPTSTSDASKWSSIIQPLVSSTKLLEKAVNRRQKQIDTFSGLPMVARSRTGNITLDNDGSQIINLQPDEGIEFPTWPGNPPEVDKQIGFFMSKIGQSGFSDAMYGEGATNVSGYALSQLGDYSRIRLEQPVVHLEKLWTWWGRKVISLVNNFAPNDAFHIYGNTRGYDFDEVMLCSELKNLHVSCEIRPEFPSEMVRKHAMAVQAQGLGLSESTIMQEYLGIQQPDLEREKKITEGIEASPPFLQYAQLRELKRMADKDDDEVAKIVYANLAAQAARTETGGRPNNPNTTEQLTGTQTATGEAPIQATQLVPQAGVGIADMSRKMARAAPKMTGGVGGA